MAATRAAALANPKSESARIYDYARTNKALANFRNFENRLLAKEVRSASLREANLASKEVAESGRDEQSRRQALNDMVYYLWEEYNYVAQNGGGTTLPLDEFKAQSQRLISEYENQANVSYRVYDTLCRVASTLDLAEELKRFARQVLQLLEQAARARGGVELNPRNSV